MKLSVQKLKSGTIPAHIGVIMDGNRRFAKRLMLEPWKGHDWGEKKLKKVLEWCSELGVKVVTFYSLSLENLSSRPEHELDYIFKLFRKAAQDVIKDRNHPIHKSKARVKFIGRLFLLPKDLQKLFKTVEEETKNYSNFFINFAVAYGGRQEIVDAFKMVLKKVKSGEITARQINEDLIRENLYTNGMEDPDLIIRTGGEKRLSNFLSFQSAYSELHFMDKMWPEIEKDDFLKAVHEFQEKERRFGK